MAAVLGVICTAAAFVLYFRLIKEVGPSRAITVTFLIPVFAVIFAAVFVDEPISASMIGGGLVVILGTALSTGFIKLGALTRKTGVIASRVAGVLVLLAVLDDTPPDTHATDLQVETRIELIARE